MLVELPNKVFTCSGSMMSSKLGSPDGGKKTKVVLFGSVEGSSGLASCPTITDASIFCSIVLPVLVSSETTLALWVELAPCFSVSVYGIYEWNVPSPKKVGRNLG
jgi:hypothetical protein